MFDNVWAKKASCAVRSHEYLLLNLRKNTLMETSKKKTNRGSEALRVFCAFCSINNPLSAHQHVPVCTLQAGSGHSPFLKRPWPLSRTNPSLSGKGAMLLPQPRGGHRPALLRSGRSCRTATSASPGPGGPHRGPPGERPQPQGWLWGVPPPPPAARGAARGNGRLLRQRLPAAAAVRERRAQAGTPGVSAPREGVLSGGCPAGGGAEFGAAPLDPRGAGAAGSRGLWARGEEPGPTEQNTNIC